MAEDETNGLSRLIDGRFTSSIADQGASLNTFPGLPSPKNEYTDRDARDQSSHLTEDSMIELHEGRPRSTIKSAYFTTQHLHEDDTEPPKALYVQNASLLAFHCLIHAIPACLTAFILSLSLRAAYWSDTNNPNLNTQLDAFQFAAKIQEMFIYVSLSAIVISVVKSQLCNHGVPFGSLVASEQFTNIRTLWSKYFWAAIFSSTNAPRRSPLARAALPIVLGLATILAPIVGPATAIAILPKLGWWPVDFNGLNQTVNGSLQYVIPKTFYLSNSSVAVWPTNVSAVNLPSYARNFCTGESQNIPGSCPAAGYSTLANSNSALNISMPQDGLVRPLFAEPITVPSTDDLGRDGVSVSFVVSTPSSFLVEVLRVMWLYTETIDGPSRDIPQKSPRSWNQPMFLIADVGRRSPLRPIVQVQCSRFGNESTSVTFPHDDFNTPPFRPYNITLNQSSVQTSQKSVTIEDNIYNASNWTLGINIIWDATLRKTFGVQNRSSPSSHFKWIDLAQHFDVAPSIAAMIVFPGYYPKEFGNEFYVDTTYMACSVDARWLPTDLWMEPTSDSYAHMSPVSAVDLITSLSTRKTATTGLYETPASPIHIDLGWSETLALPVTGQNYSTIESLMAPLGDPDVNGLLYATAILGQVVADGLARVTGSGDAGLTWPGDNEPLPGLVSITLSFFRYGYAYGAETVTFKLSAVVLLIHAAMAVTATVFLLVSRRTTSALSSAGDLLALAMKSAPSPMVQNTGAGVGRFSTWRHNVQVRDVGNDSVELLFPEDWDSAKDSRKVVLNKKYS